MMRANQNHDVRAAIHRNTTSKEGGFTLLEVLIAVAILTFGILAVASMQVSAIRGNSQAWDVTEAATSAMDRIEKLMLADYDTDADLADTDTDGIAGLDDDTAATADLSDTSHPVYDLFWNIAVNQPRINTKTVRLIVRWNVRGVAKRISLDFIRAGNI
jgi:type IV pilus modification protein PilV